MTHSTLDAERLFASSILIVDDTPMNVLLLKRILGREGYTQIHSVTDSRMVSDEVSRTDPQLILLDLHMPYIGGLEVLRGLRETEHGQRPRPVLVLTADVTTQTKHEALQAGASDFLTKPFDAVEIGMRVRNLLESHSARSGTRPLDTEGNA